jgi:hypothetical protein
MKEPSVINLNEKRIDESWMGAFGAQIKFMLAQMGFAPLSSSSNITIRGTTPQISAFAGTLMGERRYMDAAKRYGLTDPRTYQSQVSLNRAIKNFERATGIKYPIK